MKIELTTFNQEIVLSGDDELRHNLARLTNTTTEKAIYILATALMWLIGADIDKKSSHKRAGGYDCDAVKEAHDAIY